MALKLGIVGVGVIARSQHLPVIAHSEAFDLVAVASRNAGVDCVANYRSLAEMLEGSPEVEAVSLCTPPAVRAHDARLALCAGRHVMLEKPPGATISEVHELAAIARKQGVTLQTTWHSRHAAGVEPARAWLAARTVRSVEIEWREDIRVWHPGQDWILEPGGMGVFDPGINALSIITHILPRAFALTKARLEVPANSQAPIAADLTFADSGGAPIHAAFDFLQTGQQTWDIRVKTDDGLLELSGGGAELRINGAASPSGGPDLLRGEYDSLYARFAELIACGESEVDIRPLEHVADAFMLGERVETAPFDFQADINQLRRHPS